MLSNEYLMEQSKVLLGIDDTEMYDARLKLLIGGAINKLANEGIANDDNFADGTEEEPLSDLSMNYLICISYQLALDLNLDIDLQTFYVQYITRVNQLRCCVSPRQN